MVKSRDTDVGLSFLETEGYPDRVPFHPPALYPEILGDQTDLENSVYAGIRDLLLHLGMDSAHQGTAKWSPFRDIVKPGMTVFIKPNTVRHYNTAKKDVLSIITHGSILRPILDYVCKALEGNGRIIVGDSQVIFGDFDKAYEHSQIGSLLEWYRTQTEIPIECFDLRINRGVRTYLFGKWGRVKVEQDPRGYQIVDLAERSCFEGVDPLSLRIGVCSYREMRKYHAPGKHQYLFPKSFLESDVVINISKLKTHRRTGVTLAIKNFMGIPSLKDSLPHYMIHSPEDGGDQYIYPSRRKKVATWMHDRIQTTPYIPEKFLWAVAKKLLWNTGRILPYRDDIYEAMWWGNDTLWRTLTDLNRAVRYADKEGVLHDAPQRSFFGLIDGVVAGEKNGPVDLLIDNARTNPPDASPGRPYESPHDEKAKSSTQTDCLRPEIDFRRSYLEF